MKTKEILNTIYDMHPEYKTPYEISPLQNCSDPVNRNRKLVQNENVTIYGSVCNLCLHVRS